MKRILLLTFFTFSLFHVSTFSQSRTNTLTRPCAGSITPAKVSIGVNGNIVITPCSGGTTTITGGTTAGNSRLVSAQGTLTADTPFISHTATWNNGGAVFQNILSNVTDTASDGSSTLIDLQVGGVSKFYVTPIGDATFGRDIFAEDATLSGVAQGGNGTVTDPTFSFASDSDTGMYRSGANSLSFTTGNNLALTLTANGHTSTAGLLSTSPALGIGYTTGAGGAQTQLTSKATTVVSNTITTAVTMNNAILNAGTTVAFTFTNSRIAATDTVLCTHESAGTSAAYTCNAFPAAGSAVVSVRNNTAGNLTEAIVLRITVIKSTSN